MNLKELLKHILSFITFLMLFQSCSVGRITDDFKSQKKNLDSLTIFQPFVNLETYKGVDKSLSDTNSVLINKTAFHLLKNKYKLQGYDYNNIDFTEIYSKIDKLENTKGPIKDVPIKEFTEKLGNKPNSRFALIILLNGTYNPNFAPHYNSKNLVYNSTIVINSPAIVKMDIIAVIIDTYLNQIVYFNRMNTSTYDPRVKDEIVQLTNILLRSIYYK